MRRTDSQRGKEEGHDERALAAPLSDNTRRMLTRNKLCEEGHGAEEIDCLFIPSGP